MSSRLEKYELKFVVFNFKYRAEVWITFTTIFTYYQRRANLKSNSQTQIFNLFINGDWIISSNLKSQITSEGQISNRSCYNQNRMSNLSSFINISNYFYLLGLGLVMLLLLTYYAIVLYKQNWYYISLRIITYLFI